VGKEKAAIWEKIKGGKKKLRKEAKGGNLAAKGGFTRAEGEKGRGTSGERKKTDPRETSLWGRGKKPAVRAGTSKGAKQTACPSKQR